jgi:hypothetical protein
MAERIVSPGVFTRENDLSFLAQGIGEIGAAFIGPFKQGPAFVPTIVRTQSEFENIFGTPDGTYYTEYAVQNYLREAGTVTVVRVMDTGGYTQATPIGLVSSGSAGHKLIATIHSTNVGNEEVGFGPFSVSQWNGIASGSFGVSGSGIGSVTSSLLPRDTNDVSDVFGESPFGSKHGYVYTYFENVASASYDNVSVSAMVLPSQTFNGGVLAEGVPANGASPATTPYVKSQLISGERYDLFRFHTLGYGNNENTRFKISISGVKAAGEDGATDYSTFSVSVRAFDDTDKRKSVLETFNNVNLDPASPNFIARVIGDRFMTINSDGKITEYGDWLNNSKYIRVEVKEQGSYPVSAAPFAHGAYMNPIATSNSADAKLIPAVVYQTNSVDNTAGSPIYYAGFDFESTGIKIDNSNYLAPLPTTVTGSNVDFGFDANGLTYVMSGSNSTDMAKRQFVLAFQGGFNGQTPTTSINLGTSISAANSQGFDLSSSTTSGYQSYVKAINALSNADEWDINMVVTPGVIRRLHPAVTTKVIDMVEARQDAFYIADFNAASDSISQATTEASAVDSNYAGTYYLWLRWLMQTLIN